MIAHATFFYVKAKRTLAPSDVKEERTLAASSDVKEERTLAVSSDVKEERTLAPSVVELPPFSEGWSDVGATSVLRLSRPHLCAALKTRAGGRSVSAPLNCVTR